MQILEIYQREADSFAVIEAMLEGQVFHVTRRAYWRSIVEAGGVLPNADGRLPTTFGSSSNSYFKNRGCVSVFDYREVADETIEDYRSRCSPLQPARGENEGISIIFFKASIYEKLIPWTKWKEDNALREMVVPHGEAGHPGPIALSEVERVVHLKVIEDPTSLASRLRHARKRAG
jgi:hypothetical protein